MGEKKKLLLLGGGGHCKSVLDSLLSVNLYKEIGIIDNNSNLAVLGTPIIGRDDDLSQLRNEGWTDAFISIGSIGTTSLRRKLYQKVKDLGFDIPTIIDPSASIGRDIEIGEGVFVGKRAVVNVGSKIDICSIVNTGSIVEHDCTIGSFVHISPGALLCGQVSVGNDTHVGANSVIRQGIVIGNSVMIGAGSVVVKNIPEKVTAYGNPCKVVE